MAGNFWDRRPNETKRQYDAFAAFRDLGPSRSLRKAAAIHYHGAAEKLPKVTNGQLSHMKAWSAKNLWVARAEAYDLSMDQQRRQRFLEAQRTAEDTHLKEARLLQQKAIQRLQQDLDLTETEARRFLLDGAELERKTLGMPDTVADLRHSGAIAHGQGPSMFAKDATPEEQSALETLRKGIWARRGAADMFGLSDEDWEAEMGA